MLQNSDFRNLKMAALTRINFHAGFPRIGPKSLSLLEKTLMPRNPEATHVMPREFFRANLRSLINTYSRSSRKAEAEESIGRFIDSHSIYSFIAISQPGFLGHPGELITSFRSRARAIARMRSLSRLFVDQPLSIHLLIAPQADYLAEIAGLSVGASEFLKSPFSWAEVVEPLLKSLSGHDLTVWDFQEPELVEDDFLSTVLGQDLFYDPSKELPLFGRKSWEERQMRREMFYKNIIELRDELDRDYQVDLERLSRLHGLNLVRVVDAAL